MFREEAIEVIEQDIPCEYDTDLIEALDMAIAALKAEPCEDAVSRQAVLDLVVANRTELSWTNVIMYSSFYKGIIQLPPVTPKQRTGHWVEIGDEPYDTWECNNCGFVIDGSGCVDPDEYRDIYKYCPNCGARMRGGE